MKAILICMTNTTAGSSRDLTQGNPTRQLIRYASPLVISSLLQAFYGMADMIIAGRFIGEAGISAINNATQLTMIVMSVAFGLGTGGSIMIGQYFGAKDDHNTKEVCGTLFSLSLLLGLAASAILLFFGRPLLQLLGAPSLADATAYLRVSAFGVIAVFGYNATSSILRAMGNSRQPFYFIAASTVLNMLLDLLFMAVFSMGTAGAALATILAQYLSFFLALIYLRRHREIMDFSRDKLKIRARHVKSTLRLGIPTIIQSTVASLSWLTVTSLINSYGVTVSAGNGVSIKIKEFCQLFISAMASACSAMVSQNLGAGKFDRAGQITKTTMKITVLMAVVMIAIVEIFAPQLVGIFTADQQVIDAAVLNLRIEIIAQVFYAMFLVYHALAIGAGHTTFTLLSSFTNCIVFRLILSVTLNHFFGLPGLYIACMIAPSISVPMGWIYMRMGRWRCSLVKPGTKEQEA